MDAYIVHVVIMLVLAAYAVLLLYESLRLFLPLM